MGHAHERLVCSCGAIIAQCRCIDGGRNTRTVQDGCDVCKRRAPAPAKPSAVEDIVRNLRAPSVSRGRG